MVTRAEQQAALRGRSQRHRARLVTARVAEQQLARAGSSPRTACARLLMRAHVWRRAAPRSGGRRGSRRWRRRAARPRHDAGEPPSSSAARPGRAGADRVLSVAVQDRIKLRRLAAAGGRAQRRPPGLPSSGRWNTADQFAERPEVAAVNHLDVQRVDQIVRSAVGAAPVFRIEDDHPDRAPPAASR